MTQAMQCKHRGKRGFSLIELMCVIAVVSVMMAILVPSISGMGSTSARRGAVNVLMNALEMARAAALENGAPVYVVMKRGVSMDEQDSFILVRDDRPLGMPDGAPKFTALSSWQKLPKGILFYQAAGSLTQTGTALPTDLTSILPGNVPASQLFGVSFNRHGQIGFPATTTPSIYLAEAIRNNSTSAVAKGASLEITEGLSIRRYTGRPQLDFTSPPQS